MKNNSEHLSTLLEYLHDSFKGLNECAKQVESQHFKALLLKKSKERKEYISELTVLGAQNEVDKGTLLGPLHRLYIDLKTKLTQDTKQSIKEEILRGDKVLIEKYNDALTEVTSPEIKDVLNGQLKNIHNSLVEVTRMAN